MKSGLILIYDPLFTDRMLLKKDGGFLNVAVKYWKDR